jgi:hypothetical protein
MPTARTDQLQARDTQKEAFPRADLTFDLTDLISLPDINEDITQQPSPPVMVLAVDTAAQEQFHADDGEPQEGPEAEPPAKKTAVTVMYERRRSERLKHKMDGVRVDSVERASQRKATTAGDSDSSMSSASTRRRKTRRLPDINKLAPLPVTECPPETDMARLQELAACCGYMTLDAVEKALKKHLKGKQVLGTSELNE